MKEEKEKPKIFILYRKNVASGKKTSLEFAYFAILLYFCRIKQNLKVKINKKWEYFQSFSVVKLKRIK